VQVFLLYQGKSPLSVGTDELRSQDRELGICEALIRQLQTQAQLYGLEDEDIRRLSYAEGIARNLRTGLLQLQEKTIAGFFANTIRLASTIIHSISAIVSNSRRFPPPGGSGV